MTLVRRWLARLLRPGVPLASPSADPLDVYARAAPNPQQTIDIFKGGWSSRFPEGTGIAAGGAALFEDPRLRAALERVTIRGARVLELGPLEGAHSYMLQAAGAEMVVAVEACVFSYLKCLIVKDLLSLDRVRVFFGDFMPYLQEGTGTFDFIVASGVLYHQRDPIECLRRLALRADCVYLWTHYYDAAVSAAAIPDTSFRRISPAAVDGFACDLYRLEYDAYLPGMRYRGGVADHSHWMRRDDLLECLAHFGLGAVEVLGEQTEHPYGPNITLLARRSPARASTVVEDRQRRYAEQLRQVAGPEPWCVDAATFDGAVLDVSGWAIPPGGDPGRVRIHVNGADATSVDAGGERRDVGRPYWFFPSADTSALHVRSTIPAGMETVRLEYVNLATGVALDPWQSFHVRVADLAAAPPVPPLEAIVRAHAGNTQNQYLVEGFSLFVRLQEALRHASGRTFDAFSTVLDFGCGCGRVTRYLAERANGPTVGADIDAASIAWCRASLPGRYVVCGLKPPFDCSSDAVDSVVAIDVFNHFRETDGLAWLDELARITRPGGILLISIASARALTRACLSADHYASVRHLDFADVSRNADLDGVIADPDYYRNVFHSERYVRERWPRRGLRILHIFPGLVGNHNDLVVAVRES